MSNMAYCRFQNTLQDLLDCFDNMNATYLSDEERRSRWELLKLCDQIAVDYVVENEPIFKKEE